MARYTQYDSYKTEYWVLGGDSTSTPIAATGTKRGLVDEATDIDSLLADLSADAMTSPSLKSSLTQYEELVKKQLSFNDDNVREATTSPANKSQTVTEGGDEGVFDQPLSEERQLGMRAVQNTLEKLDSKHGVLQRHASAECVRDGAGETDYLKRTMSDSIRPDVEEETGVADNGDTPSADSTVSHTSTDKAQMKNSRSSSGKVASSSGSSLPQPVNSSGPQVKAPLTTKRTTPVSKKPSRRKSPSKDSKKPLKPTSTQNRVDSGEKVTSFRQLLQESKAETSELRHQIDELIAENSQLKGQGLSNGHATTPSDSSDLISNKLLESERRCDALLREKENMATELWKLRQQVEELMNSRSEFGGSEFGDQQEGQVQRREDNPYLTTATGGVSDEELRKKIEDLESQVQELQDSNDTSSAEVLRLDQENQLLTAHIKKLQSAIDSEVEAEREQLQQQLNDLREQQRQQADGEDELLHLKSEAAQLQIDLKAMQEKTNILQEENVKLRESLREAKQSNRWKGSGSSVNDTIPDYHESRNNKEAAWEEINTLKQRIKEFSTKSPITSPTRHTVSIDHRYGTILNGSRTNTYDRSKLTACHSSTHANISSSNHRSDIIKSSYFRASQDVDDRPPSPSSRSDISESTTVLMAGYDPYKPLAKSVNTPLRMAVKTGKKLMEDDDRISECTMDILNEATHSTQAYGAALTGRNNIDYEDDVTAAAAYTRSLLTDTGFTAASKSSHTRRGSQGSSSIHSESTQDLLLERVPLPNTANYGLRSVIAPVLPTQHNKPTVNSVRLSLSTVGRRPFAPRSPADVAIGDIAKFTRPDGRICRGSVKFIGHLHDKGDTYLGLELEYQDGKHDGTYEGVRYFDCKPNRGAFITFNKVLMIWGS